jgi:hypothetical protein
MKMRNSDMPAMPQNATDDAWGNPMTSEDNGGAGLTKREHFAAMAMQGLVSTGLPPEINFGVSSGKPPGQLYAEAAVSIADALLAALEADN